MLTIGISAPVKSDKDKIDQAAYEQIRRIVDQARVRDGLGAATSSPWPWIGALAAVAALAAFAFALRKP